MNIIACNDPRLSKKPSKWDELVDQVNRSKTNQAVLFDGFRDGELITDSKEAATRIWNLISEHGAEALLLDVKGYPDTDEPDVFWINAYKHLLDIREFGLYKTKSKLKVFFISRYLDNDIRARLASMDIPDENILDYYTWDHINFSRGLLHG